MILHPNTLFVKPDLSDRIPVIRRAFIRTELLRIFGIRAGAQTVKLLGNLAFSTAVLRKAIPDTLPFLFPDAADEMAGFQIEAILNYMETLREPKDS